MNRRYTYVATTLLTTFSSPVLFQEAQAQTVQETTLPEVTVTESGSDVKADVSASTKFTAPLVDTPKTVTVITSEVMKQTNSTTLVEALRTTPGITFGAGEGGNPQGDRPFIRGFDAQNSTYVDGMRDVGAQSREIFNVESVEVVKGASSAYGGGGSTGGSINLISKAPLKEQFSAGSVAIGTDSYKRVTADGNYLLGDNAAIRLNAMYHDANVAGRDSVDNNRWGFAPSITFGLNSPTRVNLSYYHLQTDDTPDSGIPYNNPTVGRGSGRPVDVNRDNFYGLTDRDFRKTQADIATARIEHDIDPSLHIRNTTRYSKTSNDYILTQPDDSRGNIYNGSVWRRVNSRWSETEAVQNQTELFGDFATGSVKHTFSVGVEFAQEKTNRDSYLVNTDTVPSGAASNTCTPAIIGAPSNYNCTSLFNPNPSDPWNGYIARAHKPIKYQNDTYSIYAFDTAELNKQWSVNLGARWDHFKSTSKQNAYPAVPAASSPTGVAINAVNASDLENKQSFWNYQAGVVYKPMENGSVYVNYSTSSDPAGLNAGEGQDGTLTAAIQDLEPERSRSYEVGTKWELADKRVLLTAALFRTEKTNARVASSAGTTELAGDYVVNGFELGVAGNITKQWQVFGGYTRLNSELVDAGTAAAGIAAQGNQFPNTPKNSASLWTTYAVTPKFTVGGGAFYTSKVYGNTANTKFVPGYTRFDAMASYAIDKNTSLQLNIQNLTDKEYYAQAYQNHFATLAPGRSAILALNVRY